jgi:sirohydrochlorin ferrochelatase
VRTKNQQAYNTTLRSATPHLCLTPLKQSSAYLLIFHGSRDPRPQAATNSLSQLIAERLSSPERIGFNPASTVENICTERSRVNSLSKIGTTGSLTTSTLPLSAFPFPLVGTAMLELAPQPLYQQITEFGNRALKANYDHVRVLPLFLLPGVHVMEDIPAEVAIAQQALGHQLTIHLCPHLGSHPQIATLFAKSANHLSSAAKILVSHGTRRVAGNQPVGAIAAQIGALPAYWSREPRLESQVAALIQKGCQDIVILPYFLFTGGITDAIAQTLEVLSRQFPRVRLSLADPLSASTELADLVIDLIH